jgi:hypothetical protein
MYLAGCAGDANPTPRGRLEHAVDHGEALGKVVSDSLAVYDAPFAGPLKTALEYVTLEFAPVPDRAHWQAKLNDENQYVRRHAQLMLDTLDRKGQIPNRYSYPVQVWQFGDWLTLVSLAGEVVVDYALRLKKERNPSLGPGLTEPWVAAYSNDVSFYVPSLRVLKEGGYEGGGAMLYYGQPGPFTESVEETIIRKVHQLVRLTT